MGSFMTTAREKLYEDMVAMMAQPMGASADAEMRKVMTRYRVQTKPGVEISPGATARDALGDRLLELWRTQPEDLKSKLGTSIDEFRMQLKGATSSSGEGSAPARQSSPKTNPVAASPRMPIAPSPAGGRDARASGDTPASTNAARRTTCSRRPPR